LKNITNESTKKKKTAKPLK